MPFEDRADPKFLFATEACEESLAALEYELHFGKGMVLITGEAGTGKTLMIRSLLMRLPSTDHTVVVVCPSDGLQDPVREVCKGFGVSLPTSQDRDRAISRLRRHFERNRRADHRSILVVDQAENLTPEALRQIVTISDLEQDGARLVQLVLVGQPRFAELLAASEFARFRQQLFGARAQQPLNASETPAYIAHRLRVAGSGSADLFDPEAAAVIHDAARGAPRLINHMCDAALVAAYGAGETHITYATAMEAINDRFGQDHTARAPRVRRSVVRDREVEPSILRHVEAAGSDVARSDARDRILIDRLERALAAAECRSSVPMGQSMGHPDVGVDPNRATRLVERLADATEEAGLRVEGMQTRLDSVFLEAEQRLTAIEDRLDRAQRAAVELDEPLARIDTARESAGKIESRLGEFAEQIAEKASDLQSRVAVLMGALESGDETAARLEHSVREAVGLPERAAALTQKAMAQIDTELDRGIRSHRAQMERLLADAAKTLSDRIGAVDESHRLAGERIEAEIAQKTQAAVDDLERQADRIARVLGTVIDGAGTEAGALEARLREAINEGKTFSADLIEQSAAHYGEALRDRFQKEEQQRLAALHAVRGQVESLLSRAGTLSEELGSSIREETGKYRRHLATILDEQLTEQKKAVSALIQAEQVRLDDMAADAEAHNSELESRLRAALDSQQMRFKEAMESVSACEQEIETRLSEAIASQEGRMQESLASAASAATELETAINRKFESRERRASAMVEEMLTRHASVEDSIDQAVTAQHARLNEAIDDVVSRGSAMEEAISKAHLRLGALAEEATHVEERCLAGEEAVAHASVTLDQLDQGAEELERRLVGADATVGELTKLASVTQAELSDALSDATVATRAAQQVSGQIDALRQSVAADLGSIAAACQRLDDVDARVAHCDQTAHALEAAGQTAVDVASTLEAVLAPGAELRDALQASVALADERCGQLNSHHAAAAQTLKSLGEANVTAHKTLKETDAAFSRAGDLAKATEERIEALTSDVQSLAARCDQDAQRIRQTSEAAADLIERIQASTEAAGKATEGLAEHLESLEEQRALIDNGQNEVAQLVERLPGITRVLKGAREAEEAITQTMTDARHLHEELESANSAAREHSESLGQVVASAAGWVERQDAVSHRATDASERLVTHLAQAEGVNESVERSVSGFHEQVASITEQLKALQDRAAGIEEAVGAPGEIVVAAQAQAAQLERVCAAVRKVFSGLSKATLQADEKVRSLLAAQKKASDQIAEIASQRDQIVKQRDLTAMTLKEWVNEAVWVQKRLERTVTQSPSLSQTHSHESLLGVASDRGTAQADTSRHAVEPGPLSSRTAPVHEVHPPATGPASRVEEISALIQDAKMTPASEMAT